MMKRELRLEFIKKRKTLTEEEYTSSSSKIYDNFLSLPLYPIRHLMSYYAIPEKKEFDPLPCEKALARDNKDMHVYWPRMEKDGISMQAILMDERTIVVKNLFNIAEPAGDQAVPAELLDAVFVPLLAFDQKGYRVGYGKGYYDRFLQDCRSDVVKIGFSFFAPVEVIDDINEFDVPLNYCITPARVYEF